MADNTNPVTPASSSQGESDRQEQQDKIELEVRRILSEEGASHRAYLEGLINQLKWSAGVVALVAGGMFVYFTGKTYSDVVSQAQSVVSDRMVDYKIKDDLKKELKATINTFVESQTTDDLLKNSVRDKIKIYLGAESEGYIQKIINKKADDLKIRDFSKDIASLPVGTIISSMLAPDVFSKVVGDDFQFDSTKSLWVLADGRVVSKSRYSELSLKETIPDLRGMFLRGLNSERNDGRQDPQNRIAGSYQSDEFKAHKHAIGTGGADSTSMVPGGAAQRLAHFLPDAQNGGSPKSTDAAGGEETRPKNVAVYYYVRIN